MAAPLTVVELEPRLPRPLDEEEKTRAGTLIEDAWLLLRNAFRAAGRDLEVEAAGDELFAGVVELVLAEMVAAPILVGASVGRRSVSSSTGPQSDSETFTDTTSVGWAGVRLTDSQRIALGLPVSVSPRFRFPRASRWPERR